MVQQQLGRRFIREVVYEPDWHVLVQSMRVVLVADIGGTNSNFGIITRDDAGKLRLCISLHMRSQEITDYAESITLLLEHIKKTYQLTFVDMCIGAAGVIGPDRVEVKPTNLPVTISRAAICARSGLQKIILMNDFEAVGLGIDHIAPSQRVIVSAGLEQPRAQKACIGAGTGLGKAALIWNDRLQQYLPFASEGGHADCAVQTDQEFALFQYIRKNWIHGCPVSWEDLLSGNGISLIYQFLQSQKTYPMTDVMRDIELHKFKPDLISHYAQQDGLCFDTLQMYVRLYARCAKNFALDTLSLNGLYIAGGIAAHNVGMFASPLFHEEFQSCGKHHALLRTIPLYVIADYNVSLYGAAAYYFLHEQGII